MKGKTQSLVVDIAEDYLIQILMYFLCSYFHEGMGPGAWLSPGHSRLHTCKEIAKGYLKDRDGGWLGLCTHREQTCWEEMVRRTQHSQGTKGVWLFYSASF